ncbi:MAG: alkaline phosphatase family protein [Flavobacteriales bacterium]|nr:alkaline phosphatase family protein [Flavobacteriales bacterium]
MNRVPFVFLALSFSLLVTPLLGQDGNARVLVIGIDGTRPDCLEAATTPALDALIADGIYSPDALNNDITYSGPGWSAMLCGVWSDAHGVTSNNFVGSNFAEFPSFMRRLESANPDLNTHSIGHWAPINDYILGEDVDEAINAPTDVAVRDAAVDVLENGDPHAVFLHFDDVDINGHGYGFNAGVSQYIGAIETTDGYVAQVMQALTSRPNYTEENWLVLVSTDHGGIGYNHGGTTIEEETMFFIASGPTVDPLVLVKDTLDVTSPPENCIAPGAAELQFEGGGDAVVIADDPALQLGSDQDFTFEIRIRTSATPDVAIFGNKDWNSGLNPGFVFSFEYPNGPAWKVNIGDGSERADANGSAGVADGQWHTLSCSFDRDGMMRLYTDGDFVSEEDISNIGDIDVGEGWFMGSDIFGAYSYTGAISEVRFWHGVLDGSTIANWHCSPLDETHPQWGALQGHWSLSEGEGTAIGNSASDDLLGTVQGAEWMQPEGVITFDYSNTPRIVDVAVTALDHMCLPLDPVWNLAGISWVDGCSTSDVGSPDRSTIKTSLYPNPGTDDFHLTGLPPHASIEVFDPAGRAIHWAQPGSATHTVPHTAGRGTYLIRIVDGDQHRTLRWIRQ